MGTVAAYALGNSNFPVVGKLDFCDPQKLIVEVAIKYEEDVIGLVTCRRNYY